MNSPNPIVRPCTLVWLLLMAITLVTWAVGETGLSGEHLALAVLGLALIKGWLVGDYFMGLRTRQGFWRWPIVLWLLIPGLLIGYAFSHSGV